MQELRETNLMQLKAEDNWSIKAKKKPVVEQINHD